jgi:23S rRNA pseudouridine955/2504/2580 synthase
METIHRFNSANSTREPVKYTKIDAQQAGRRIDNFLYSQLQGVPRARIYRMLRKGEVRVDGKRVKQDYRLQEGQQVRIPPLIVQAQVSLPAPKNYLFELLRDSIIYEDKYLIAINKPAGLVVHSGTGRSYGVIELLRQQMADKDSRLQLVHRLDRETSGVLLIAKTMPALSFLHEIFRGREVRKYYQALLKGHLHSKTVQVDLPISSNRLNSGERMSGINEHGKGAISTFRMIRRVKDASLVEVEIMSGRTHQIRVHAAAIEHPVAGDAKYGSRSYNKALKKFTLKRQFLHASRIYLPKYLNGKPLTITAPLPQDLQSFLDQYT